MFGRRNATQSIDSALVRLGEQYALPPERAVALEARVHDDVMHRFGTTRIAAPQGAREPIHTSPSWRTGILILFRPAAVVAVVLVLVVGTIAGLRHTSDGLRVIPGTEAPVASSDIVRSTPPVEPGSGSILSVFGQSIAVAAEPRIVPATAIPTTASSVRVIAPTAPRARVNPAPGVFSQWGTGVFSEDELLRSDRLGKNAFSS